MPPRGAKSGPVAKTVRRSAATRVIPSSILGGSSMRRRTPMGDGNCLENSWSLTGLGSSTLPRLRQSSQQRPPTCYVRP